MKKKLLNFEKLKSEPWTSTSGEEESGVRDVIQRRVYSGLNVSLGLALFEEYRRLDAVALTIT
jgi:hypothetical protein